MSQEPIHPQLLVGPGEHDLAALVRADLLKQTDPQAAGLRIVLLPRGPGAGSPRQRLTRMVGRLHAAAMSTPERGILAFVQFGGGYFGTQEPADPETCAATAFAASLHLE